MDVGVHPLRSVVAIACRPKKEGEDGDSMLAKSRKTTKKADKKLKKQAKLLGGNDGRLEFWD